MSELYLIAHKVRGAPTFDIAERICCPICEPMRQGLDNGTAVAGNCNECDDGYWWILSTCGYRAYPYWVAPMNQVVDFGMATVENNPLPEMPENLRDCFQVNREKPKSTKQLTLEDLGL